MTRNPVFLKLGGSLITVKNQPHTPRLDVLERMSQEIAQALDIDKQLRIILGHGSGSFGHVPARKYQTRLGVKTTEEWLGFAEVWQEANELNHLVIKALKAAGLPVVVFSPSAAVISTQGRVASWNLYPLQRALEEGLLPVVHGDVVFDLELGGTILSTEDLFAHLTSHIQPERLLFAGIDPGVWVDFPENTSTLAEITPESLPAVETRLKGSAATDVTGGMADKVRQAIALIKLYPDLKAAIFSGEVPGNVRRALLGESLGTQVHR
jgi:isopentenyl phosphate kinase